MASSKTKAYGFIEDQAYRQHVMDVGHCQPEARDLGLIDVAAEDLAQSP